MYLIQLEANPSGSRPPLQSWLSETAPSGYALCPDEFFRTFYSTTPAGFVEITTADGVVTAMTVNQTALDAYIADHPPQPKPEPEPTADEVLDVLLGVENNE